MAGAGLFILPSIPLNCPFQPMRHFYSRWITQWEHQLATRDTNRVVRPFEWGLDWLPGSPPRPAANGDAPAHLEEFVSRALGDSDRFFAYEPPTGHVVEGRHLTFTSPVRSPYPVNDLVHADFFQAACDRRRAVLVLPQWNADAQGHAGLCKLLNLHGIHALRMSLAYHDRRRPDGLQRADYHLSSNVGRTIHASRQSVIDARACLDWLQAQGFRRLGILGTSLGSCIAFITAAHDQRVTAAVFNHVSMYFADVVWTGLSTQHVRKGFHAGITQDQLRRYWSVISPASYLDRMAGRRLNSLLIWARYDSSFLPRYSLQVLDYFRTQNLPHEVVSLPCGHYTTGQFPFKIMDGLAMCRFLDREL
jgi:pimeloyl-ACP methyl ester carboxylesterase